MTPTLDARERKREYNRRYYLANKDKWFTPEAIEQRRQYALKNPEGGRARSQRWRERNADRLSKSHAEWIARNRERYNAYMRQWRREHPASAKAVNYRRRAREHAAPGSASRQQIESRIDFYGGRCWMCGATADTIDHVIPLAGGGSNWPANLRPACRPCNARKRANRY